MDSKTLLCSYMSISLASSKIFFQKNTKLLTVVI